jgi:hypothetical protein
MAKFNMNMKFDLTTTSLPSYDKIEAMPVNSVSDINEMFDPWVSGTHGQALVGKRKAFCFTTKGLCHAHTSFS